MTRAESDGFFAPLRGYVAIYFLFLSGLAAVAAYYRIFTGFSYWDDEGYMMMTVKEYLTGVRMYNDVISFYGPVYYLFNWLVRSISQTPVNHNTTRLTSAVVMVTCPLICAWIVMRFTKCIPAAAAAHIITFRTLDIFAVEPGHPQELCLLLLLGLAATGFLAADPRRRGISMALMGAIAAALLLVKINIGVFAILAVAMAVLFQSPVTKLSCLARVAVAMAALALPVVLMKGHLDDSRTRTYCFVATASIAALLPALIGARRTVTIAVRDWWIAPASFAGVIVAVLLAFEARGTTLHGLVHSLVELNVKIDLIRQDWYSPLPFRPVAIPLALVGLVASVIFAWLAKRPANQTYELLALVKLIFGSIALLLVAVFAFTATFLPSDPLGRTWPGMVPGFVTPFCWLLLYQPSEEMDSQQPFPRTLLCNIAVLQLLYAFPVAGSQGRFVRIFLIVVGAVSVGDSIPLLKASFGSALPVRRLARTCAVGIVLLVPVWYVVFACQERREYNSLPSLALPGADRIHLPPEQAQKYQWLTRQLRDHCDVFLGMPDIMSFYFWTGIDSIVPNAANWKDIFDDEQQMRAISALSEHPGACIVYDPQAAAYWHSYLTEDHPLVRYVHDNFVVAGRYDNYNLMVRKERVAPAH